MRRSLTHWLLDDLVILGVLPLVDRLHELLTVPVLLDRLERLPDQLVVRPVQLLQIWVVLLRVGVALRTDIPAS